jgi:prepilin-type processing-associated H-X9-DG protein
MSDSPSGPRTHPGALASLLLGLSSLLLGLLALTGLPALIIGLRSLRAINASDGRERGTRMALTGMILGGISTLLTVLGVAAIVVVRVQESSRRTECVNHLRLIGAALNIYADTHGTFPAATWTPPRMPPEQRQSWLADVLPLLAQGQKAHAGYAELFRQLDRTKAWDDPANAGVLNTAVRVFLCPAHPDPPSLRPGRTHYVGVAGIDPDAADLSRKHLRAGMFGHDRGVARREAEGGISYTFMVLETAEDNGPWLAGGQPTVRGLPPDAERYSGPGQPFGGLHHRVVNVLWVDGSVRPLSDDTPAEVFRSYATLRRPE